MTIFIVRGQRVNVGKLPLSVRIRDWLHVCGEHAYVFATYPDYNSDTHFDDQRLCLICGEHLEFGIGDCTCLQYSNLIKAMCRLGYPVRTNDSGESDENSFCPGYIAKMHVKFRYYATELVYGPRNFWLHVYSPKLRI